MDSPLKDAEKDDSESVRIAIQKRQQAPLDTNIARNSADTADTNEDGSPNVTRKPKTTPPWRSRSRRFSLGIPSRSVHRQPPESDQSPSTVPEEENSRGRKRMHATGGKPMPKARLDLGHTTSAREGAYFHRLCGSHDVTSGEPSTMRDRRGDVVDLSSVMTQRYRPGDGNAFSTPTSSSPLPRSSQMPSNPSNITRSISAPYFHSWSYGNIDVSHHVREHWFNDRFPQHRPARLGACVATPRRFSTRHSRPLSLTPLPHLNIA